MEPARHSLKLGNINIVFHSLHQNDADHDDDSDEPSGIPDGNVLPQFNGNNCFSGLKGCTVYLLLVSLVRSGLHCSFVRRCWSTERPCDAEGQQQGNDDVVCCGFHCIGTHKILE
jgi:hypothetical protein